MRLSNLGIVQITSLPALYNPMLISLGHDFTISARIVPPSSPFDTSNSLTFLYIPIMGLGTYCPLNYRTSSISNLRL